MFKITFKKSILSLMLSVMMIITLFLPSLALADEAKPLDLNAKVTKLGMENPDNSLVIVHTNDTHSRVLDDKYAGMGFAKISSIVKSIRENNKNVLLLDAGDTLHGQTIASLAQGATIVDLMNAMGYDAMTSGNHDFNYGQDRLLELSKKANFPILASNVIKKDGKLLLNDKKYIIKDMNGLKVGIFGLSTPETAYKSHPDNVKGLSFVDPTTKANEIIKELKGKVDIIVAIAHLGVEGDTPSKKVAENVDGIDVLVDGHSHTVMPEGTQIKNTLIVQTGEYDTNLGVVRIDFKDKKIASKKATLISKTETASIVPDKEIADKIATINKDNEKITSVVVGKTDIALDGEREHVRKQETNFGNLIADSIRYATKADISFINGGNIRCSIPVGDITKGQIITAIPFGNTTVVKEVKGSVVLATLEHGVSKLPESFGGYPHVSGMTYDLDPSKEAGHRIYNLKINNSPVDLNKNYKFAFSNFAAAGGDDYTMLKDGKVVGEFAQDDEIFLNYIQAFKIDAAKLTNRCTIIKKDETLNTTTPVINAEPVKPATMVAPTTEVKPAVVIAPATIVKPATVVAPNTYIVVKGDTLAKIAAKFNSNFKVLANNNKIKNPNKIYIGQNLMLVTK